MERRENFFLTSDGVRLHYRLGGKGEPLVILNGLSGDIHGFDGNYDALERHFTVCNFDYRAHGSSEVPQYGYHIERLTKDFVDFLDYLKLDKINLIAHSMGNTIAWCYMSLFGQDRIKKYILVDEAPCLYGDPAWSEEESQTYMGNFRIEGLWGLEKSTPFGPNPTVRERMIIKLFRDHLARDWRDEVKQIKVPTLILMGGGSHFNSPLLWNWLHELIEGSKLEIISADKGGTHNMFATAPDEFNRIVLDYLVN